MCKLCVWRVFKVFLTKFFGRGYMNNVVGCHVILVPCAQILETKCSNQPSGKRCLTMSQVMSCEYHVKNVGLIGLVLWVPCEECWDIGLVLWVPCEECWDIGFKGFCHVTSFDVLYLTISVPCESCEFLGWFNLVFLGVVSSGSLPTRPIF